MAGLIHAHYEPGRHGSQKVCSRTYDQITIRLPGLEVRPGNDSVEVSMPVGNYKEIEAEPTCGLASESGIIGLTDDPRSFYLPDHVFAQLSMEICSEAPNYCEDWPSDITLWVNGVEVGTWTSPGRTLS